MLQRLRPRSAYDVIALLALFVAVGTGGAYAANTIGSADVIDESLLSQDIKNGEVQNPDLGTNSVTSSRILSGNVFNSDLAPDSVNGSKVIANSLTSGDLAPNSVSTSELTDGSVTTAKLAPQDPFNEVGDADGPGWAHYTSGPGDPGHDAAQNFDSSGHSTGAFYRDSFGVVHLKGVLKPGFDTCGGLLYVFTLPAGYRPSRRTVFATMQTNDQATRINVDSDGFVSWEHPYRCTTVAGDWFTLDGITFRAEQ